MITLPLRQPQCWHDFTCLRVHLHAKQKVGIQHMCITVSILFGNTWCLNCIRQFLARCKENEIAGRIRIVENKRGNSCGAGMLMAARIGKQSTGILLLYSTSPQPKGTLRRNSISVQNKYSFKALFSINFALRGRLLKEKMKAKLPFYQSLRQKPSNSTCSAVLRILEHFLAFELLQHSKGSENWNIVGMLLGQLV